MTAHTSTEPRTHTVAGVPALPDRSAVADTPHREFWLDREQSSALDRVAAEAGGTPADALAAVYAAVLARHTGTDAVTFGVHVAGRRGLVGAGLTVRWAESFAAHVVAAVAAEPAEPPFLAVLAVRDAGDTRRTAAGACLVVTRTEDGWALRLEHDSATPPGPVLASLREAATRAAADPSRPLADLFTDGFEEQVSTTDGLWFRPPVWHLDGWLRRTLNRYADSVAVEENGSRLTYRNLAEAVRSTSAALRGQGVRAGHVVGLTTDTLVDTVVAMLAALRIGARYLPLADLTPEQRATRVAATGCQVVVGLGASGLPDDIRVLGPEDLIEAAGPWAEPSPPAGTAGYVHVHPDGTGVDIGMEPLFNLAAWQVAALGIDQDTRFLQYAPLGSAGSFQEIVPALAMGGIVVATGNAAAGGLPAVVRRAEEGRITHMCLPAGELTAFARAARRSSVHFGHLRYLCVSGRPPWPDEEVRAFLSSHPDVSLVVLYGPDGIPSVTTYRVPAGGRPWPARLPVGRPISGVSAQVIDRSGHLAPAGVPGELVLGGHCPATARSEPDPYGPDGARRYRTGAVVSWTADGDLVLVEPGGSGDDV